MIFPTSRRRSSSFASPSPHEHHRDIARHFDPENAQMDALTTAIQQQMRPHHD